MDELIQHSYTSIREFLDKHKIIYHYYGLKKSIRVNLPNGTPVFIKLELVENAIRPIYVYYDDHIVISVPPGCNLEIKKFIKWGYIFM